MNDDEREVEGRVSADADQPSEPIQLKTITVKKGRIICDLCIPDERYRRTSPKLAAFVTGQFPDLPHHTCVNGVGPSFGMVMESTSVAHLLEHVAISLQTQAASDIACEFVGTTEWVDEQAGEARIEMSFHDDLEALRALSEATRFLNIAVLTCLA